MQVFRNPEAIPITAERARPLASAGPMVWPGPLDVVGWQPVLSALAGHTAATGVVAPGTVYAGYAPAGSFSLTKNGRAIPGHTVFGWARQYPHVPAGPATLSLRRFPFGPLGVLLELLAWVALTLALLGWPGFRARRARSGSES